MSNEQGTGQEPPQGEFDLETWLQQYGEDMGEDVTPEQLADFKESLLTKAAKHGWTIIKTLQVALSKSADQ